MAMTVMRKTVSFAQQIAIDRRGDPYVYGGNWEPYNRATGTDCSGCVIDVCDAVLHGTGMQWRRNADGGGGSTEDFRPPSMGGSANPLNGPFGAIMVSNPSQYPSNAAALLAFHHGPGGGENSHTWCQVDKLKIETNGDNGTVLNDGVNFHDTVLDVHTIDSPSTYGANNWWYLPGPIIEDGTPIPTQPSGSVAMTEPADTLWADVSEFQAPVDGTYWAATYMDAGTGPWNYRVLSIRSNDGDHVDVNFAKNYAACVQACEAGQCELFFVYYYWRPGSNAVNNHMSLIKALGGPHPNMVSMIDLESGDGNPNSDVSTQVNSDYHTLASWLGDERRVIGYANVGDERTMWQTQPSGFEWILAGYGSNPTPPSGTLKLAHQYTDGQGYGNGLPEGAPPFGNCDMNSADGLSPSQLAAVLGVGAAATPAPEPDPTPEPTPEPEAAPLTNAQMQDLYNMVAIIFQQTAGIVPGLTLLPGSPTPFPATWPQSLAQVLNPQEKS